MGEHDTLIFHGVRVRGAKLVCLLRIQSRVVALKWSRHVRVSVAQWIHAVRDVRGREGPSQSMIAVEAPGWRGDEGAYLRYLTEEQRSQRGCIGRDGDWPFARS
jgi:hypothetical protein